MSWQSVRAFYAYFPLVETLIVLLTLVRPARLSLRARLLWTLGLLAAGAEPLVTVLRGDNVFLPRFPEPVVWCWGGTCIALFFLAVLSVLCRPLRGRWKLVVLPLASLALAAVGVWNAVRPPEVRAVELVYDDLPAELDGYRIVQLSDVHCSAGARRARTERIVAEVNALGADLACLTGDYVDGWVGERAQDIAPLAGIRARDGVYCIAGNHEFYFKPAAWRPVFDRMGLRFLANGCVFPRRSLALAGVSDKACTQRRPGFRAEPKPDVGRAFAAATNGEFRVLLEHRPADAARNFARHGVRLQLSGHSHGGVMPLLNRLVARVNGGFCRGLYALPGGWLYVSSGAGQAAAFPVRYRTPAEIALFTLRRGKAKRDAGT